MIDVQTQLDLFKLISRNIEKDVTSYAFGGTAMMFYGYKTATKDIDLVFETEERDEFVKTIEKLGYSKMSIRGIYPEEKQKNKDKPIMYTRGDERFDIFTKKIFTTTLTKSMTENVYARHDFAYKENALIIKVLSKESIIALKSITERENDFSDILAIVEKEKKIDWDYIISLAIEQKKLGNKWFSLDLEKTMQRLRNHTLIKKEYFDALYREY